MPEIAPPHHVRPRIQSSVTRLLATAALLAAVLCPAQTRRGPSPEALQNVTRALAVYEWTGDLAKPTAARVIPVSLFLDQHFEVAALYLSRPVPLALLTGTVYELQSAGVNRGTVTLQTATHLRNLQAHSAFDDGWFGYATFKPLPKPVVVAAATPSNAHVIANNDGRPHFAKHPDTPASPADTAKPAATAADAPPADTNRPVLHHTAPGDAQATPASQPASTAPGTTTTAPPTQTADATPAASTPPATSSPAPASDPDRPTLKHAPPQTKKQKKNNADSASVTDAGGLLADDPNRPRLHHGPPTGAGPSLPPLKGLPADLHQLAAVSDAADRPEHDFAYAWPDDAQKAALLAKLETMARAALPAPAPPPPVKPVAHTRARKPVPPPPAPIALLDEQFHAYEISYGGVNVFVFTAHTAGEGADLHYVTLLAQPDIYGEPQLLLKSVTDAAHLDQSPRMRFVDAVDADGDNRAELLFELRGQTQRQFALYRIAQGTAQQAFLTGNTQ
ncbi:MAG TPA: hypothetical protein VGB94_07505 [Acidobacteriaceae bacterium]